MQGICYTVKIPKETAAQEEDQYECEQVLILQVMMLPDKGDPKRASIS